MSAPEMSNHHIQQELLRACHANDAAGVIEAISRGAHPNRPEQEGHPTPLEICARKAPRAALSALIEGGARVQPDQQLKMAELLLESWSHGAVRVGAEGPVLDRLFEQFEAFALELVAAGLQWSAIDQTIKRFDKSAFFWHGHSPRLASWHRVAREWSALKSYQEKEQLQALSQPTGTNHPSSRL